MCFSHLSCFKFIDFYIFPNFSPFLYLSFCLLLSMRINDKLMKFYYLYRIFNSFFRDVKLLAKQFFFSSCKEDPLFSLSLFIGKILIFEQIYEGINEFSFYWYWMAFCVCSRFFFRNLKGIHWKIWAYFTEQYTFLGLKREPFSIFFLYRLLMMYFWETLKLRLKKFLNLFNGEIEKKRISWQLRFCEWMIHGSDNLQNLKLMWISDKFQNPSSKKQRN